MPGFNISVLPNALLRAPLNTLLSFLHCRIFLHLSMPLSSAVFLSVLKNVLVYDNPSCFNVAEENWDDFFNFFMEVGCCK